MSSVARNVDVQESALGVQLPHRKDQNYRHFVLKPIEVLSSEVLFDNWNFHSQFFPVLMNSEFEIKDEFYELRSQQISKTEVSRIQEESLLVEDYFVQNCFQHSRFGFSLKIKPKKEGTSQLKVAVVPNLNQNFFINEIEIGSAAHLDFALAYSQPGGLARESQVFGFNRFILREGSTLNLKEFHDLNSQSQTFLRNEFILEKAAKVELNGLCFGEGRSQARTEVTLKDRGSHFFSRVAAYANERSLVDIWINSKQNCEDTEFATELWSVVRDSAKVNFNAWIEIGPQGKSSKAYQLSKALLLSNKASVETRPNLMIATDDVQVSHGASISNIEDEQLFYLESRGISRAQAEQMIVEGFGDPVIEKMGDEDFQEFLKMRCLQNKEVLR